MILLYAVLHYIALLPLTNNNLKEKRMWGVSGQQQQQALRGAGQLYGGSAMMGGAAQQPAAAAASASNQKNDIFVGNLAFNTTEEQLHQAFSEVGRVINVRMVTDVETGKPRGFAFVEFQEAQAALSAIRNMNDYELNGRRLRVNFSNSSHLEVLAGKLGMDLSQQQSQRTAAQPAASSAGTNAVADSLKAMSKAEMYDCVAKLKEIAEKDQDEARRILSSHPQLPEAMLFLMSKLDMVKTPIASTSTTAGVLAPAVPVPAATAAPVRPADPRAAAAAAAQASQSTRTDPRQAAAAVAAAVSDPRAAAARVDPRQQQRIDPRTAAARATAPPPPTGILPPPPPPQYQQQAAAAAQAVPPPPPPPVAAAAAAAGGNISNLDPAFAAQVMSLTPQQIQQLPPDKQQSILQLRQQITGSR